MVTLKNRGKSSHQLPEAPAWKGSERGRAVRPAREHGKRNSSHPNILTTSQTLQKQKDLKIHRHVVPSQGRGEEQGMKLSAISVREEPHRANNWITDV